MLIYTTWNFGSHHTAIITAGTAGVIWKSGYATFKYKLLLVNIEVKHSTTLAPVTGISGANNQYSYGINTGGNNNELGIRSQDDISFATGGTQDFV